MMAIQLPESWLYTSSVAWAVVLVAIYAITSRLSLRQDDPREPPVVAPIIPIPFVGHLLGMALQGGRYVKSLGYESPEYLSFSN